MKHLSARYREIAGRALTWGVAVFVAACTDSTPAGLIRTQPAVTASPDWSNEPTGATVITDQPWDSRNSLGWAYDSGTTGAPQIVSDASASFSPTNAVEFAYPIGFPGGGWAPGAEWANLPSLHRVYVGMWWKPSSPWQGASSFWNAIAYLQTDASGQVSLSMYGQPGGPYELAVRAATDLMPNVTPHVTVTLGAWHRVEWLVDYADPGNAQVKWWLDGQLVGNYANLAFPSAPLTHYRLEPVWSNDAAVPKAENDYFRFDHTHISGNWTASVTSSLILDEGFSGMTRADYEAHGWYDGTTNIVTDPNSDGYKFETDPTLGRNVMFVHWSTVQFNPSDPAEPGNAWRYCLQGVRPCNATGSAMPDGATAYILFKTHNVATSQVGGHWTRFGRGFGDITPGNSDGQMDMDLVGLRQKDAGFDPATGQPVNSVFRTFEFYIGGNMSWVNPAMNGILNDDTWYEMAYFAKPGTAACTQTPPTCFGTSDGALRVIYRAWSPGGTNAWTTAMAGQNINTAFGTGNITQFLISPYMARTPDIRQYYATIRLYAGNAICDRTIDSSVTC